MDRSLPIFEVLSPLKAQLEKNNTVILQAAPGAGKSTVLPLELLNEVWLKGKKILMLEPRRLAARSVAFRLAESLGEEPGETIGYRVRFDQCVGKNTRIEVLTEGILTRRLQNDNALEDVGLVIFDEFHERSLHADLALVLCREIQQVLRNDLRILVMSATLDGEELSAKMDHAPLICSAGRQFPIRYHYLDPDAGASIAVNTVGAVRKALKEEQGDVLVFLPGSGDIRRAEELLENNSTGAVVHALYGDLPQHLQQEALLPDKQGRRKIVLATSIAETSLTIEGIKVVVDCGYARVPKFDPRTGFTRLETVRVTLDTADQRAGRAGRLTEGVCYRLWSQHLHRQLAPQRKAEILEADLAPLYLELAQWGHNDPGQLKWISEPPVANINRAKKLLEELGAISNGKITEEGRKLLDFPTHPRIAHLLLYGKTHGFPGLAADVAALLEEKDPLKNANSADLFLRIELLRKWRNKERTEGDKNILQRIEKVSRQWQNHLKERSQEIIDAYNIGSLIAAAYPERIAKRLDKNGRFRMGNGRIARLHQNDPLGDEDWIAIAALDAGSTEAKVFLAAAFNADVLLEIARETDSVYWDEREGVLRARKEWRVGDLIVKEQPLNDISPEKKALAICAGIRNEGLRLLHINEQFEQLQSRVLSLQQWEPDLSLPDLSEEKLLEQIEDWLPPYLHHIKNKSDLNKLNLHQIITDALDWNMQQLLNERVPEKIKVPSGSEIRLKYHSDGSAPVLAARLQECFGMAHTPTVNMGKNKVVMHLLSPGYKPVQITQDLNSFWNNTYKEVKKELRIRYPRHAWPDDPWTAEAIRGAVKKR